MSGCDNLLAAYESSRAEAFSNCPSSVYGDNGMACLCTQPVLDAMLAYERSCTSFSTLESQYSNSAEFVQFCRNVAHVTLVISPLKSTATATAKPNPTVATNKADPSVTTPAPTVSAAVTLASATAASVSLIENGSGGEPVAVPSADTGGVINNPSPSATTIPNSTKATATATSTSTSTTSSDSNPLGISIGGWAGIGVGGLIVLLFLLLFIIRCCNKLKRSRETSTALSRSVVASDGNRSSAINTTARDINVDSAIRDTIPRDPPRHSESQARFSGSPLAGSNMEMTQTKGKEPTRLIDLDDGESITSSQQTPSFFDVYSNPGSTGPALSSTSYSQFQQTPQPPQPQYFPPQPPTQRASVSYQQPQPHRNSYALPSSTTFNTIYSNPETGSTNHRNSVLDLYSQPNPETTSQHRSSFIDTYGALPAAPVPQKPFPIQQQQHRNSSFIPPTDPFADYASEKPRPMSMSFTDVYAKPVNARVVRQGSNPFEEDGEVVVVERRQSFADVYSRS
ncbi:hypothetical protein BCR33DRAFT_718496 [Rhizoclosmatium globosum]|uniref:Extracellular membrane protein CFEM domain-containing protein n=1 Tax=Rhizoclosmatium globosum TaxID=329046 RepID=A0A1Y2C647_9FUNG|nr:hypothetical protein BCR33DRAFT_718496 [Rhizoclosmatium globosum]|eukprot:ORY42354.1 hypothetical protein BCR33DRAFT_718496 [Rhizoclosmatium globosum]